MNSRGIGREKEIKWYISFFLFFFRMSAYFPSCLVVGAQIFYFLRSCSPLFLAFHLPRYLLQFTPISWNGRVMFSANTSVVHIFNNKTFPISHIDQYVNFCFLNYKDDKKISLLRFHDFTSIHVVMQESLSYKSMQILKMILGRIIGKVQKGDATVKTKKKAWNY